MTDKQIIIDEKLLRKNRKNLTGMKIGKLTCLKPVKTGKNKNSEWLCECECGNYKIAQTYRLLSGRVQSCGDCYHTTNHYIPMIKELEEQLSRKEQECEELEERLESFQKDYSKLYQVVENKGYIKELDQLKAELAISIQENEEGREINAELKAQNEELKKEKRNFRNFLTNKYNYGSFRPMWGAYLLKRFFKEDLGDFFDEKAYEMADTIEEKEKQLEQYSQALTEIKQIAEKDFNHTCWQTYDEQLKQILQKCEVINE